MMKRLLLGCVLLAVLLTGCTVVTQDQKNWIEDKANRSNAYVVLMDEGKTTSDQDKEWIKSQNESWKLWAEKVKLGLAAPSFLVDTEKEGE
jgi:outer membrane PBP1 activator LpoA protein